MFLLFGPGQDTYQTVCLGTDVVSFDEDELQYNNEKQTMFGTQDSIVRKLAQGRLNSFDEDDDEKYFL